MKKLLGLLGTITIAGSGISGIVGNAPASEIKSKINYSQTNNLEALNKNKRAINNYIKTEVVKVGWDSKKFLSDLCNKVLKKLLDNEIIKSISDSESDITVICDAKYFVINNQTQYIYFVVPFAIERDDQSVVIDLIFRSSDFYLQGFTYNTTYYHFDDSAITSMSNKTSRNLRFDSNYNTLIGQSDPSISWTGIESAFQQIINYGENPDSPSTIAVIRGALARVILATAESMRFRQVRTNISNSNSETFYWRRDFYDIITNWGRTTGDAIAYIMQNGNLNNFVNRGVILIFTSAMFDHLHSCNNNIQKRYLNKSNDYLCYNKKILNNAYYLYHTWWTAVKIDTYYNISQIKNVLSIGITPSNQVYYATTNGVYYIPAKGWDVSKINGINESIKEIITDNENNVYFINII